MQQLTMFSMMPVTIDRAAIARRRMTIKDRLATVDYAHMNIEPPAPSRDGEIAVMIKVGAVWL